MDVLADLLARPHATILVFLSVLDERRVGRAVRFPEID